MRIVFMGTPEFAVPSLERLIADGYEVAGVFTQPDRPKGRGNRLTPSPVKVCAAAHGISVFQPERIRRDGVEDLKALLPVLTEAKCPVVWDADALKEVSHGFVVSQFDYRPGLIMILVALIILLIAACAVYMIANLIYIWKPHLHPACRRLKHFGLDGEDFTEIDHELAEDLLISAGQIYVTENYLIVIGKRNLWMVPLFNIVWAYKYSEWNPFVKKKKLTYSLVIVTSPKEKITIRGNKKPHTDKILQFLDSSFTHITVGYSDEIREQMEELL